MLTTRIPLAMFACVALLALPGCGQKTSAPGPTGTPIGAAAADAEAQAAADAKAAELAARERDLADRETALKQQELEAELARRDQELAAAKAEAEAAKAVAAKATAAKAAASKPAAKPASKPATSAAVAPATPIVVPAGTSLDVELTQNVNTKRVLVGAPVEGRLVSDVVINGRTAAKAGAAVKGTVVEVVSGSDKIGGTPSLALRFDTLMAADGAPKTINAAYSQQLKSETGRDTAKIVGGAAAGAVVGHQVGNDDKGTIIGGLLGAGAGTAAAKKTGGDIKLVAGQVLTIATSSSFEVKPWQ